MKIMQKLIQQFTKANKSEEPFKLAAYQPLFQQTVHCLTRRQQTITAAESLTAGLFQATLATISGASAILKGGFVTYSLEMKVQLLNLSTAKLRDYGVVSRWTSEQMAQQSSHIINSDWGVGLTGVAGPDSLEGQNAGTVWIAIKEPNSLKSQQFHFSGSRNDVRQKSVVAAFIMLIDEL